MNTYEDLINEIDQLKRQNRSCLDNLYIYGEKLILKNNEIDFLLYIIKELTSKYININSQLEVNEKYKAICSEHLS